MSGGGGGGVDIWIQGFAPGSDPVPSLMRVFGIDETRAVAIQQTVPRAVRRNATPADAEAIAAALRSIGAKVELRPSKLDPRASGTGLSRPGEARASGAELSRPAGVRASGAGLPRPELAAMPLPEPVAEPTPARPSASDDAMSGGAGLELAFDPNEARARAPRASPSSARPPHQVSLPPPVVPAPAPEPSRPSISFSLPGWLRGVGCASFVGVFFFLFRMGRCACSFVDATRPPSPAEVAELEAQNRASVLADAVELDAFLARPNAMLGRDMDRNAGFATRLRTQGATRVLVTDIARVSGGDVGLTLVIELPPSPAVRRRILLEVERYYANGQPVSASDVELPPPTETFEFVDLE
ncbi:MAG: hypothetical protein K1X94_00765 [Sandaracinaceae bacterium]|nr:hypothetical protein [Sandaracinaceae bacterium]